MLRLPHIAAQLFLCSLLSVAWACRASGQEEVIEMDAHPASVDLKTRPLRLLPTERELSDGNAVPVMLRMTYEQTAWMEKIYPSTWELADLEHTDPKIQDYPFDSFANQLKKASKLRDADWEYDLDSDRPWEILLPDVQSMRNFAGRGMKIWINQRIGKGDLRAARDGVKTQLASARHIGRTPILVCHLVCARISQIALERLEVIVSQPDSPNLFWSLGLLPDSLVDVKEGLQWESGTLRQSLPSLQRSELKIGDAGWKDVADEFIELMGSVVNERFEADEIEVMKTKVTKFAHLELLKSKRFSEQELASMSGEEKVMRWTLSTHELRSDRMEIAYQLPAPKALAMLAELEKEIDALEEESGAPGTPFLGNGIGIYLAVNRFDRQVKLLQNYEGIRHYIAMHDGQLPATLDDVPLPLPNDPMTLTPFQYSVEGDSATLQYNEIKQKPDHPIRAYRIQPVKAP
ncbi:MAG: hypothetical protein AAFV88_24745 [Planctomycetota bacterium]